MNITVFCSAYSLDDRYSAPAAEFARLLLLADIIPSPRGGSV